MTGPIKGLDYTASELNEARDKMSNLYKIKCVHFGPKDYRESMMDYVISDNEQQVMSYVDGNLNNDNWVLIDELYDEKGKALDLSADIEEYEKAYAARQKEILDNKGNIGEDMQDLHYGHTQWGWELIKENLEESIIKILLDTKVAYDIRHWGKINENKKQSWLRI